MTSRNPQIKSREPKKDHLQELYEKRVYYDTRKEYLREKQMNKELAECTFTPRTTMKRTSTSPPHSPKNPQKVEEIYSRSSKWNTQRMKKIEHSKLTQGNKELLGCTFAPQINLTVKRFKKGDSLESAALGSTSTSQMGLGLSLDVRPSSVPFGYYTFIEKQHNIRKIRQLEEQDKMKKFKTGVIDASYPSEYFAGVNWKNDSTVPKEFKLGKNRTPIKSLNKPVSSPLLSIKDRDTQITSM